MGGVGTNLEEGTHINTTPVFYIGDIQIVKQIKTRVQGERKKINATA